MSHDRRANRNGTLARVQRRAIFAKMAGPARGLITSGVDRGIDRIATPASFSLHRQADHLLSLGNAPTVAILTGFPIVLPDGDVVLENDGPLGSALLAAAFVSIGWRVILVSDETGRPIFNKLMEVLPEGVRFDLVGPTNSVADVRRKLQQAAVQHLISIERPGAARDNEYYNMRAETISQHITAAEDLVVKTPWSTAAFADGGNEIGMGKVGARLISKVVQKGKVIASKTKVEFLTLCGVSNWGAYGLLSFLSVGAPQWRSTLLKYLTPTFDQELFNAAIEGGAVDGVTKQASPSVDNLPLAFHHQKILDFRALTAKFSALTE